jgi:putative ABC transport system permease protein
MTAYLILAWRNVLRHRRRSIPPASAIAGGVVAIMLAAGFIEWGLWYGRESTIRAGLGHIRIFLPGYQTKGLADPFAYLLSSDLEALQQIRGMAHVRAVAPKLAFNGLISRGDTTISFIGEGVAPEEERVASRSLSITQGDDLDETDRHGIILGHGLAANLGVKPGDRVVLLANTASGGVNGVDARIRGVFVTITKAYDDTALRVPIALSRELLRVSGAHSYALLLDETSQTEAVLRSLEARFGNAGLEFVPWHRMADFYNKTAELFSRQMATVRAIIAAIIVLSILNSMMMAVMERTNEIGTAMALGWRRGSILRLFLLEGLFLGFVGGVVGMVAGFGLAFLLSAIGIPMPPAPGMAFGYTAEIRATWPIALNALGLALATALAASAYPAWRASRLQVIDALRQNR